MGFKRSWVRIPPARFGEVRRMSGFGGFTACSSISLCRAKEAGINVIPPFPYMRSLLSLTLSFASLVTFASAQDAQPSPTATPAPTPVPEVSPSAEPVMPEGSPAPTAEPQAPPDLLPESKSLPAQPNETPSPLDLIPEGTKVEIPSFPANKTSAEQQENDRRRFRQLRTIAARDPYAIYLFDRAKVMKTDESRRQYTRAYYLAICNQMRKIEPRLRVTIDAFEAGMISRVNQHTIKPTVPIQDMARFRAAEREPKHSSQ